MKENESQIRHQPPGEVELVRHPPKNSVCAGFRAMLRDYADQDLTPTERKAVDEHLHRCRDCSLALSRSELEVLRIRSALTGRQPGEESGPVGPPRPRRGFTRSVLARLHEQPASPRPRRLHRAWILLPAAAAVVAGIRLGGGLDLASYVPLVEVVAARNATWLEEGQRDPAETRDVRHSPSLLEVGARGHAELVWAPTGTTDPASGQPTVLRVEGDSRVSVGETATLYRGALTAETGQPQVVDVPGAGRIHLGVGRYSVSAVPTLRFDGALTSDSPTRVRLEVLDGQPAEVEVVFEGPRRAVVEGDVALYDGWSPVLVERAVHEDRMGAALRPLAVTGGTTADPVGNGPWLGRLVGPDGVGLAGATVHVTSTGAPAPETVESDRSGRFRVTQLDEWRGRAIMLQVTPRLPGVALYGPVPRSVPRTADAEGLLLGTVQLGWERPVEGRVRDEEYQWVPDARVVPLLVDEVLGLVQPLWATATWSDRDGHFTVRGLPMDLAPHTSLVLLADHPNHPPTLSFALAGTIPSERDRFIDLDLKGLHGELTDLVPGQAVTVALELQGLPAETFLRMELTADDSGRASVRTQTDGRFWIQSARGERRALLLGADGLVAEDPLLATAVGLPGGERDDRGRLELSSGHRYERLSPIGDSRLVVISVVDARTDVARRNARLFLLPEEHPRPVYLGEYDGVTGFSAPLPRGSRARVLALGQDGSAGLLEVEPDAPGRLRVRVQSTGGLALEAGSQPRAQDTDTLDLQLRSLDGDLPGRVFTRRLDRDRGFAMSGLLPGLYEVSTGDGRTGRCRIESDRTVVLRLSR